jgi:hypothetical protein
MEYDFDFANAPDPMIDMVTWYRTETGRTKETITFEAATDDYDRRDLAYFIGDFDASFPTSSPAYTAADNGCPVGDLNWFDVDVAACLMGVASEGDVAREALALSNGPNPFRDATTVRFTLPEATDVALEVYDALGRRVATLASGVQTAGEHSVRWNAAGAAAGVYVVRLHAGDVVASHRVLVVR